MWNVFFRDVSVCATQRGSSEAKFADDLNTYQVYPGETTNDHILCDLEEFQRDIHQWGVQNRVAFDPGKEQFWILHRSDPYGLPGRLLGAIIDQKLIMEAEVSRICGKVRPKIKALLRTRSFYSMSDMVAQYKAHIWA